MSLFSKIKQKRIGGFTMAELMITIAAFGLLAAIAIPAYIKQEHIARQKEAKATLGQLASAMKSFFAEYAGATARFDVIGFNPSGDMHYVVGFSNDKAPPPTVPFAGKATCIDTVQALTAANCGSAAGGGPFKYTAKWTNDTSATGAGTIGAYIGSVGQPASFGGPTWHAYAIANFNNTALLDGWAIDSNDNLQNTSQGI